MTTADTYLDIGIQGIQRYLGRTPDLKGRRGASAWLSHATDRGRLARWLANHPALAGTGVRVNAEAGEADGVIPLRLPAGSDAAGVADMVLADLRRSLPGVRATAIWAPGATYVEAYRAWTAAEWPSARASRPAGGDLPALRTCQQCRIDPVMGGPDLADRVDLDGKPVWLCADCHARYVDCYRSLGLVHGTVPVSAELQLLNALGRSHDECVQGFDDLALLGDADSNRNHLATVYADGNAIGDLFGRVIDSQDPAAKAVASKAVSAATREALAAATRAVLDDPGASTRLPVIPHVVGGDDLLVSVVADRAWRFVTAYIDQFEQRLRAVDALRDHLLDGRAPSTSAGIVFARATFPFRHSVELAADLLATAKAEHSGARPAVAWLDVTQDGHRPPPHRRSWLAQDLFEHAEALRRLRQVPAAGRAALERLADPGQQQLSVARLREHTRRLDRAEVLDPFLCPQRPVAKVAEALSLVRWWR